MLKKRAAIIARNVDNLIIDGLQISWPTGKAPNNWKHKERIENGKIYKVHLPNYGSDINPEFSIVYFENLNGGNVFTLEVKPFKKSGSPFILNNSNIKIRD